MRIIANPANPAPAQESIFHAVLHSAAKIGVMLNLIIKAALYKECGDSAHGIIVHEAAANIRLGHFGINSRDKGLDVGPKHIEPRRLIAASAAVVIAVALEDFNCALTPPLIFRIIGGNNLQILLQRSLLNLSQWFDQPRSHPRRCPW